LLNLTQLIQAICFSKETGLSIATENNRIYFSCEGGYIHILYKSKDIFPENKIINYMHPHNNFSSFVYVTHIASLHII